MHRACLGHAFVTLWMLPRAAGSLLRASRVSQSIYNYSPGCGCEWRIEKALFAPAHTRTHQISDILLGPLSHTHSELERAAIINYVT